MCDISALTSLEALQEALTRLRDEEVACAKRGRICSASRPLDLPFKRLVDDKLRAMLDARPDMDVQMSALQRLGCGPTQTFARVIWALKLSVQAYYFAATARCGRAVANGRHGVRAGGGCRQQGPGTRHCQGPA